MDGKLFEIKGYETAKDKEKYKAVVDFQLIVLKLPDLKTAFNHVKSNYSFESLVNLYDNSKYRTQTKNQSYKIYCKCGNLKWKTSESCAKCPKLTKASYPEISILLRMVEESNYTQVGKMLGVNGNSVKRYLQRKNKP